MIKKNIIEVLIANPITSMWVITAIHHYLGLTLIEFMWYSLPLLFTYTAMLILSIMAVANFSVYGSIWGDKDD